MADPSDAARGRGRAVVVAVVLAATAAVSVVSASVGAWPAARLFAVVFLVVQAIALVGRWSHLAAKRKTRRELAVLVGVAQAATGLLVLDAVGAGRHHASTIKDRVGLIADVDADLDRLEHAALLVGTWEERTGQPPQRRYDLTSEAMAVLTNTLHPDAKLPPRPKTSRHRPV